MKTFNHEKLNECKILVESEKAGKHYALVQSCTRKNWSWRSGWDWRESSQDIFYIMWGNEANYETMGHTGLFTDRGNPVKSQARAIKLFTEMMIVGANIEFKM